jgi:Secretion system C-terminal sorting domain
VAVFQNWLNQRASWIGTNIGGTCQVENEPFSRASKIILFPNPSSGSIRILSDRKPEANQFKIINAFGQSYDLIQDENGDLDISRMPDGIYTLEGKEILSVRFVKLTPSK